MTDTATEVAAIEEGQRLDRLRHRLHAAALELNDAAKELRFEDAFSSETRIALANCASAHETVVVSLQAHEKAQQDGAEA